MEQSSNDECGAAVEAVRRNSLAAAAATGGAVVPAMALDDVSHPDITKVHMDGITAPLFGNMIGRGMFNTNGHQGAPSIQWYIVKDDIMMSFQSPDVFRVFYLLY